jgi:hypothetical protein
VPSDTEVEDYLRLVRVQMDVLQCPIEQALSLVPETARDAVRKRWQQDRDQPIRPVRILSGQGGPRPWFAAWRSSEGYLWRRLRSHLIDRLGRSEIVVGTLDDTSNKVLAHLEDPRPGGPDEFRVMGLVIGYVQSGKTASISALIAKAADLGYRLVFVLSGLDDGLRKQTQDRLACELGIVEHEGCVGLPEPGQRWVAFTTGDLRGGDFNPGVAHPSAIFQGGQHRGIAVVKKNPHVLQRVVAWARNAPADLPVLVIDDEADQASVNTGGNRRPANAPVLPDSEEDDDPSRINERVRDILRSFRRVSYVAYTATPFANVFIDPDAVDEVVQQDLYPRDFIISLPKPPRYLGAERLFGRDALEREEVGVAGLDVVRLIPDADVGHLIPPRGGQAGFLPRMCRSLEDALLDYVVGGAAKIQREGSGDTRATMLIHTSHLTAIHNRLATLVREHMTLLRQRWRYDRADLRHRLQERWDTDFRHVITSMDAQLERTFEQIEPHISTFLQWEPDVRVLNITSDAVLDYSTNPTLKVIVIGGNRLSRGLTLEDLMVSYYVRAATNYDTLLQMGRWFGYRERYVDLTRLWTTSDLAGRFSDLALIEEELRDEIAVYERANITPMQFAPKIRKHPAMAITAANKMRASRDVQLSFQGELRQTSRFPLGDLPRLRANLESTRRFLRELGPCHIDDHSRPEWIEVPSSLVCAYLDEYISIQDVASFDAKVLSQYVRRQVRLDELVRWRVSVRSLPEINPKLGTEDLGISNRPAVNTILRSRKKEDHTSIGVLTSPARAEGERRAGDEETGLTDLQIDHARQQYSRQEFPTLGHALRAQRSPAEGLLLVYPVSRFSEPDPRATNRLRLFESPALACTVVGLALVFPPSASAAAVEYCVGPAGWANVDDEPE